jgi:hypothetical protein
MIHKVEVLKNLANKNDYEATRLEKLLLKDILPSGKMPKEDVYALIENIYGVSGLSFSLIDSFEQKYEELSKKLKVFAENNGYHLEATGFSTPLKIKELEEDVTLLDFKLKIRALLIKNGRTFNSKIESEIDAIFERLNIIRNNLFLITNYISNVNKTEADILASEKIPTEQDEE